jgi:hypothetical protein
MDVCAKAGTAGRKPIESAGDTVSRDDMEALLDYARDVIGSTPCPGNLLMLFEPQLTLEHHRYRLEVAVTPGPPKSTAPTTPPLKLELDLFQ